jgi:transposase
MGPPHLGQRQRGRGFLGSRCLLFYLRLRVVESKVAGERRVAGCGGAHFLGRALREQGHEVRLTPAQYVKGKFGH